MKSLYPSLGRHFSTMQELADAGCMSRTRLYDCLSGRKDFTRQEKQAIYNAIIVKERNIKTGDFDETFRKETA